MEFLIVIWLICGLIGALIGQSKNRRGAGLLLGFGLGIVGLIILVFLSDGDDENASISAGGFIRGFMLLGLMLVAAVVIGLGVLQRGRQAEDEKQQVEAERIAVAATPPPWLAMPQPTPAPTPDPALKLRTEILQKYGTRK